MKLEDIKKIFQYSSIEDVEKKGLLVEIICYLAIFFLIIFSYRAYNQGMIIYSYFQTSIIFLTLLHIFIYKKNKNLKILIWHINIIFSVLLCYMAFTGGTGQNTGLIWFQVFPVVTFAINSLITSVFMIFLYITLAIIISFTNLPFITHEYPENVILSFYGTLFFIIAASFVSQFSRTKAAMSEDKIRKTLKIKSERDELTGSYNRRHMNKEMKKLFSNNGKFSLAFADIDNFKNINDTYGHDIGDEVIKQVSKAFQDSLRENDYLARWGGEEFVLVFKDIELEQAYLITERIRKKTEALKIDIGNHKSINVTCSFGVENSKNVNSQDDLISKADKKLYKAKNNGRNLVIA